LIGLPDRRGWISRPEIVMKSLLDPAVAIGSRAQDGDGSGLRLADGLGDRPNHRDRTIEHRAKIMVIAIFFRPVKAIN
jgi:hypothetical protein